jgi:hypothetical protein
LRECVYCHEIKPISQFSTSKYHLNTCFECRRKINSRSRHKRIKEDPLAIHLHRILSIALQRAKRKGIDFDLDYEFLVVLYEQQGGKCFYSGRKMISKKVYNSQTELEGCSIDRIDSSKGYVRDNVVLCCWQANIMKAQLSHEELIQWCKDVINNGDRAISV